ncbi:SDR family oxidoreductase [Lentzea jiangxiensis]|uniref:NAD(P)-dependent dehydrogenase, short-chain alcohol dehydrogenase family n=1 Tax=Lentzea jiangxiensis TaxID=641025 RepID=A0A1H0JFX1_9PSEU|nr:SDR family oxidoreductase [Lentzea jiangxiensis]SDO42482.1 NAD(P)-dependent dehydrogenase, short-chain alcohol dehydrogenase family [Lentzea jiangxiensis]
MSRVVVVTGAGRGIGRAHALAFGATGARVVVNDLSAAVAGEVAELIGPRAVVSTDDVGTWAGARRLVQTAVETFGGLDVLVNNAGIVRDRMVVSCGEDEWDEVVRVHLKGHFATLRHAAAHWRAVHKAGGAVSGRVVNTSSGAGLFGSVGQANYSAAKAGIAAMTLVAAAELARYGVTVNAIAPAARTRMTEATFAEEMAAPEDGFDAMAPENVSPLVVWLGSEEAGDVTGRMFEVDGGRVCVVHGWRRGPEVDRGERWSPDELGDVVRELVADDHPTPVYGAG